MFIDYFVATVQMVYNLLYYQIVAQVSCGLTRRERAQATAGANEENMSTFADALCLINKCLEHTALYMEDDNESCFQNPHINIGSLEAEVGYSKL